MWTLSSPQNRNTLEQIPLFNWGPDYTPNFQSLRVLEEDDEENVFYEPGGCEELYISTFDRIHRTHA